jgi:hypothetical protein
VKKVFFWFVTILIISSVTYFITKDPSVPSHFDPNDFTRYDISINQESVDKMDSLAADALSRYDFSKTKIWFKGKVNGEKAKVRLKGDKQDHYDSDLLSMRVKFSDSKGKHVFSLTHPKTRRYLSEWIFHQLLKSEGLPYLNYEFAVVYLNNEYKGLYAREEHFSNPKIHQGWDRPKGPILAFDDEKYWPEGLTNFSREFDTKSYKEAEIKCFNEKNKKNQDYKSAVKLLKEYQSGTLVAKDVFDLEKMGQYYALVDLVGGSHSLRWINCRFYYNKLTKRLEPAGFDSDSRRINNLVRNNEELNPAHHERIFSDSSFSESYNRHLDKYSSHAFLADFYSSREDELSIYIGAFKDQFNEDTQGQMNAASINQWVIWINIVKLPWLIGITLAILLTLVLAYRLMKKKRAMLKTK